MIIIEFLDLYVLTISYTEGILQTTRYTVRILGRKKAFVHEPEEDVSTPKQPVNNPKYSYKATFTRRATRAAHTFHVPPITQVHVIVRCLFPGLVHTE